MALFELRAIVVPRLFDQQMILKHLLRHKGRQKALVLISCHLRVVCLLASSGLKARPDLLRGVVVLSTKDLLVECRVTVFDDGLDEFAYG